MSKPTTLSTGQWTRDDVERWLTDYPLPATFVWNGTRAYPRYTLKKGYGFWLRTAGPHYPALRGLFVLCCDILIGLPTGTPMPTREQLAELLQRYVGKQESLKFSTEDNAAVNPHEPNPAEDTPS